MKKQLIIFAAFLLLTSAFSSCQSLTEGSPTDGKTTAASQSSFPAQSPTITAPSSANHIYTFFPSTTVLTTSIQNSIDGVVVGKTSLKELRKSLDAKGVAYEYDPNLYSVRPPSVRVKWGYYFFDEANVVDQISVDALETERGVKMGDSIERIIAVYGDGYQKELYGEVVNEGGVEGFVGETTLEYTDGRIFLSFWFGEDNLLSTWAIRRETIIKGMDPALLH